MRNNTPVVAILGCGWLGIPLAEHLIANGYSVKGSTTTDEKLPVLKAKAIDPYNISLSEKGITGDIEGFLADSDIVLIDIPPKIRSLVPENFVKKIATLTPYLETFGNKKIVFISSSSVYPDEVSYNYKVTESYSPQPDTEGGKQLLETEQLLQSNPNFKTTILRFGGLIGKERHPVKHLSGRDGISNPQAPINMIHLEDCIGIIHRIIATETWGELFNAVAPLHPDRETYYHKKAQEMNLALPKFAHDQPSVGKLISSEKLQQALAYTFSKTDF
ncbi:SDR family oxidoreductase [Flavobacterium pedocola]